MQNEEYHQKNGQVTKETCLVLELAPNGELLDFVCTHGKLAEPVCRFLFSKLLDALKYC